MTQRARNTPHTRPHRAARLLNERRMAARAPVELDIDLHHVAGVERACRSQNLTRRGLFIEGVALAVGSAVEIEAALPYLSGRWRVPGCVVSAVPAGVGVRFTSLPSAVRWALNRVLDQSEGRASPANGPGPSSI